MQVILSSLALKKLKKISRFDQIAILKKLKSMELQLPTVQVKKLGGYNLLCLRVGNYRIVYEKQRDKVYVPIIAHRREVYNLLKRLF
jgi:mRNA-degrading endonuclease RelE of RelBE toxin-antitoxin system